MDVDPEEIDIEASVERARDMIDKAKAFVDPRATLSDDRQDVRNRESLACLVQSVDALVAAVEGLMARPAAGASVEPETMRQRLHGGKGPIFPRPGD
jgi:hypothetical protein